MLPPLLPGPGLPLAPLAHLPTCQCLTLRAISRGTFLRAPRVGTAPRRCMSCCTCGLGLVCWNPIPQSALLPLGLLVTTRGMDGRVSQATYLPRPKGRVLLPVSLDCWVPQTLSAKGAAQPRSPALSWGGGRGFYTGSAAVSSFPQPQAQAWLVYWDTHPGLNSFL